MTNWEHLTSSPKALAEFLKELVDNADLCFLFDPLEWLQEECE